MVRKPGRKPKTRKSSAAAASTPFVAKAGATPRDYPPRGVGAAAAQRARLLARPQPLPDNLFAPYKPADGVLPPGASVIAMDEKKWALDDAGSATLNWAASRDAGFYSLSGVNVQRFMGFPALALLAQRAEYRVISEIIATEMTRKWIELESTDGGQRKEKFDKIHAEMVRLRVRECFHQVAQHDGWFGRGHIVPIFNPEPDDGELKTDIGDGIGDLSRKKIAKDSLKSLRVIEPMWIYPAQYNSTNPMRDDWYKPTIWYVQQKNVHTSRLLTFIGREVPDLLKPSYAFGGLSMTQIVMPTVENWLDVRGGVTAAIKGFSIYVLKTNTADLLLGGNGDQFYNRLDIFNSTRDQLGVMAIDMKAEDFINVAAPLGSLDHLQAQAQEHMASVSRIPLVKLTGISPSGLNATGEQEMQCFEDHILAYQEMFYRPNLTKLLGMIQLSLFGEVDPHIGFKFLPLGELTEQEHAELRKSNAETGEVLIRSKALSTAEERERIVADRDGPYSGLDPKAAVVYPMTEVEKAGYAASVATTAATLVSESIIGIPTALKEIQAAAEISGIGLQITDDDIEEAENAPPPAPPAPGDPNNPDDGSPPAAPKIPRALGPAATKGLDEFKESDHPRGQPGNAGQFGPGGGGKGGGEPAAKPAKAHEYRAGLKAHGAEWASERKKIWRTVAPSNVDELIKGSPKNQAALAAVGEAAAKAVGVEFKNPGVKSEEGIRRKIAGGKTAQEVNDAVRAGFDTPTPEASEKLVRALAKKFEVADEGWTVTPQGYFDRKVMVRFEDGQIGEVQMWAPGMLEAKEGSGEGHKLYEAYRTESDPEKLAELSDKMNALYKGVQDKLDPSWQSIFRPNRD